MRRLESLEWWPDVVAAKDELSLRELARRFDVTPGAIAAAIRRTGVARRPSPPGPKTAGRRTAAPVPVATPAASPRVSPMSTNTKGFAWAVTFPGAQVGPGAVVIAGSLNEALEAARRVGEPVGIQLLGPVL